MRKYLKEALNNTSYRHFSTLTDVKSENNDLVSVVKLHLQGYNNIQAPTKIDF